LFQKGREKGEESPYVLPKKEKGTASLKPLLDRKGEKTYPAHEFLECIMGKSSCGTLVELLVEREKKERMNVHVEASFTIEERKRGGVVLRHCPLASVTLTKRMRLHLWKEEGHDAHVLVLATREKKRGTLYVLRGRGKAGKS